jgi:FkbM family methyltransferase
MIKICEKMFSKISGFFKFDILWRIIQKLPLIEKRNLTWRLVQQEAEQITFCRDETMWTGNAKDSVISACLFSNGSFQREEIQAVIKWMKRQGKLLDKNQVIIDIGANIGTTCIHFAQQTECTILAIEPVPDNFALLKTNVNQNNLGNRITCVQKAISNTKGKVDMILPIENSGGAYINQSEIKMNHEVSFQYEYKKIGNIPTDSLTNVIKSCKIDEDQIVLVWSDTEGAEVDVILTGAALWKSGVPLFVEINPYALQIQGKLDSITNVLSRYFDRYIESKELIKDGFVTEHPISGLPLLIDNLIQRDFDTDVILLPNGLKI